MSVPHIYEHSFNTSNRNCVTERRFSSLANYTNARKRSWTCKQKREHQYAYQNEYTQVEKKRTTQRWKKTRESMETRVVHNGVRWTDSARSLQCRQKCSKGKMHRRTFFFTIQRSPLILSFFFPFSRALSRSMCATHWKFQNAISPRFLSNWWMCVQFNSFQCTFSSFSVSSVTIRTFAFLTTSPLTYTKFDMKRKRTNFSMLKNATDQKKKQKHREMHIRCSLYKTVVKNRRNFFV